MAIIETSQRVGWVALALGGSVLAARRLDEARRHARDLVPALGDLLAAQGWPARDLHGVIVSRGPGSYTGLRVGIMSAKTLAYAAGCALVAVDTFAAVALQSDVAANQVIVLADAQQDKVYRQHFVRQGDAGLWQADSELGITPFEVFQGSLAADDWIGGPGMEFFADRLPHATNRVAQENWLPRPESLLRVALERWRRGERDDPFALEPLYLRPSSAEERFGR